MNTEPISVAGVTITTPERSVYPQLRYTKLDLARLYADIGDWVLPHVKRRPLTMVRCDKGVNSEASLRTECRFLRHEPGWHRWVKPPIRRLAIQEQKKVGEYLVIDSLEGLLSIVQGDILELHLWNSSEDDLEHPDRIVFDLDPGAGVEWTEVVGAARLLRKALADLELECWPKLSGGKGLHIVLPFEPEVSWDEAYEFSRVVAESLAKSNEARFTVDFARGRRTGKLLIDYKRNHRAAVAVAPYSTRARPNGPLAVPVSWTELKPSLRPDHYTVANIRDRLSRLRRDPWEAYWSCRQSLRRWVARS